MVFPVSLPIPCNSCVDKALKWIDEKVAIIHHLEKNVADLEKSIRKLKAKRDDLQGRVTREEDRGKQRLGEVQVWFTDVEGVEKETETVFGSRDDELKKLCLCGFCSKSLISSYRYGKKVVLTLREVERLSKDVFEVVVEEPQTSVVQEIQHDQPVIVGQESVLDEAWTHLMKDQVGMMGLYGMGGVGKTTLLKELNNKFSKDKCGFDFVIWIAVTKDFNREKIRDDIAKKVGLRGEEWKQKETSEKVDTIYNFLRKKRFVLFLDDLWEKMDLAKIGVPFPKAKNKCKVAFTTRSQDVCAQMGIQDPLEVKCLTAKDAFKLFQEKVGKQILESDPEIPRLATIIAKKCHGLPLALNVIGETMACKKNIRQWYHAIDVLDEYSCKFSGMEDKILSLLKFSYDNLKDEELKSCFLYCALFNHSVSREKLVDYWICEGMKDETEGMEQAKNKGYEIIGSLVSASLLMEKVDSRGRDRVYLHDVVREMALWIASDLGLQKEAFVVHVGVRGMPKVENWKDVRRMSLKKSQIHHLVGSPECPELTTLLLKDTKLEKISSEFFKSMPKLAVLDVSRNESLVELPGLSEVISLQYLNLSATRIHYLPIGEKGLKKVFHLDLRHTHRLMSLAGISNLPNLKVLKLSGSCFQWDLKTVEELETLERLEVLTLSIEKDAASLERYLNSHRLASCTRELTIKRVDLGSSEGISLPVTMEKLHKFSIQNCGISEIKMVYRKPCFLSLSSVKIVYCKILRDLTFLMFAPNLTKLEIDDASEVEDIINEEKACEGGDSEIVPFQNLISLHLKWLPELKSVYWRPLSFPCLKQINVNNCPNLKRLPLDSQSGRHGKDELTILYGQQEWIEGIEWEDEATKTRFLSSCKQTGYFDKN